MSHRQTCPWQGGPILASSVRKLLHNPRRIVTPYLAKGMTAMDIGCAMGFFTIPMSDITGERGRVIAVDLQAEMLTGLQRNAQKAGCNNITLHQCSYDSLKIKQFNGTVDFALVFMMLHEVPDADRLVQEVYDAIKPGGKLLFTEPIGHVGKKKFEQSLSMIRQAGFKAIGSPKIRICRSAILQKQN